jgi:hypothetical protein
MRLKTRIVVAVWVAGWPAFVMAQPRPEASPGAPAAETGGEVKAVTKAILDEIDQRSELMGNIEYLCDMIGPRLTGSPNLTKANEWTRDKFRQYGLSNAHLEPWTIERAWTRGDAKGRVVEPVVQRILVESAGWSPSTTGALRGPVVYLKAKNASVQGQAQGGVGLLDRRLGPAVPQAGPGQPGRRDAAADA